jgi:hypothetical protein
MGQPQPPQFDAGTFLSVFIPLMIIMWALAILGVVAMWRVFSKAGQPGWAAIVPVYNTYVLLRMVGRPGWWLALLFVPIANVVILVLVMVDLATAFGKSGGFAALLILLPFVGLPILAFSNDAVYRGPVADPNFAAWQHSQNYGYPQQQPQMGYPQQGYPPQQGPWH